MIRVFTRLIVFLTLCGVASADPFRVHITATYDATNTSPWAPYTIEKKYNAPSWMETSFKTFCVENDRFFRHDRTYWATIDDKVLNGGSSGHL